MYPAIYLCIVVPFNSFLYNIYRVVQYIQSHHHNQFLNIFIASKRNLALLAITPETLLLPLPQP